MGTAFLVIGRLVGALYRCNKNRMYQNLIHPIFICYTGNAGFMSGRLLRSREPRGICR